jgi:hypothetical protein
MRGLKVRIIAGPRKEESESLIWRSENRAIEEYRLLIGKTWRHRKELRSADAF